MARASMGDVAKTAVEGTDTATKTEVVVSEEAKLSGVLRLGLPAEFWGVFGAVSADVNFEVAPAEFTELVRGTIRSWHSLVHTLRVAYEEQIEGAKEKAREEAAALSEARTAAVQQAKRSAGISPKTVAFIRDLQKQAGETVQSEEEIGKLSQAEANDLITELKAARPQRDGGHARRSRPAADEDEDDADYAACEECGDDVKPPKTYKGKYDDYVEWVNDTYGATLCYKCRPEKKPARRSRR